MQLRGLGVALITPFDRYGALDLNGLERLVDFQIQSGVDYLVVLGTTAETPVLSKAEQDEVQAAIISANGNRVPLVLGVGSNDTRALCESVKKVDANRFDAILSVTPYYNKPSQKGLKAHYQAIAQVTALPIILYNVPSRTGVNLLPSTVVELASSDSAFIGIKEACGDAAQIADLLHQVPSGFEVVSGDDLTAIDSILMGASGVISVIGQALPERTLNAVSAALSQNRELATSIQQSLTPLIELIFEEGNPVGVKALLAKQTELTSVVRLPLVEASSSLQDRIAHELNILNAITV